MKKKFKLGFCAALLLAAGLAMPLQAQETGGDLKKRLAERAENIVAELKQACQNDIQTYCKEVTPGAGRMAFCMIAHEDKISDQCVDTLFSIGDGIRLTMSNVMRAVDACEADVSKLCGDVEPGQGRVMQCIRQHQGELSANCRADLAGLRARAGPIAGAGEQRSGVAAEAQLGAGLPPQQRQAE